MTLPASGPISMSQVASELGISQTGLNLNHSWVRSLAGAGTNGLVSFGGLRGQTAQPQWVGNAGSGPALGINMSVPFFRGTTSIVGTNGSPTSPTTLSFSSAPTWSGNITLTNRSSGQSMTLNKQDNFTWVGSAGTVLRANSNDTYSLAPSN